MPESGLLTATGAMRAATVPGPRTRREARGRRLDRMAPPEEWTVSSLAAKSFGSGRRQTGL